MSDDNLGLLEALDAQLGETNPAPATPAPEPKAEAPKAETPKVESPKAEAPKTEATPEKTKTPTLENKIEIPDDVIDQLTKAGESEKFQSNEELAGSP